MASLYALQKGDEIELFRILNTVGFTLEDVERIKRRPKLAEVMLSALRADKRARLIHGLFTPPEDQIAYLKLVNKGHAWGFTEEDFAMLSAPPEFTDDKLVAVVLTVRLPDHKGMTGLQRTFDQVYAAAGSRQKAYWRWEHLLSKPTHLRLWRRQREHKPGLSWARLNLGANNSRSTQQVRDELGMDTRLPEAELLSCALMHPYWVRAMNGSDVQFVDIAGYEVNIPGCSPWQGVPDMCFDADYCELELDASDGCSDGNDCWGVPVSA